MNEIVVDALKGLGIGIGIGIAFYFSRRETERHSESSESGYVSARGSSLEKGGTKRKSKKVYTHK